MGTLGVPVGVSCGRRQNFSWSICLYRNRPLLEVCKFARGKPYPTGFVKRIRRRRDQGRESPAGSSRRPVFRPSSEEMGLFIAKFVFVAIVGFLGRLQSASGIRFVLDREECFSHSVLYEGDKLHVSYVVIKADSRWQNNEDGLDLVVKGPSGNQIHDSRGKTADMFEFVASKKGLHSFCFTNKSPYYENVDFDIHVTHFQQFDQHVKDEHFHTLVLQISKLEDALFNVQFEQHWLEAQTERQALINEDMSRRAVYKVVTESVVLVGVSLLQVFLLRRLFERKLSTVRV